MWTARRGVDFIRPQGAVVGTSDDVQILPILVHDRGMRVTLGWLESGKVGHRVIR